LFRNHLYFQELLQIEALSIPFFCRIYFGGSGAILSFLVHGHGRVVFQVQGIPSAIYLLLCKKPHAVLIRFPGHMWGPKQEGVFLKSGLELKPLFFCFSIFSACLFAYHPVHNFKFKSKRVFRLRELSFFFFKPNLIHKPSD